MRKMGQVLSIIHKNYYRQKDTMFPAEPGLNLPSELTAVDFGQVSLVFQASIEDRAFVSASAVVENDRQNLPLRLDFFFVS